MRPLQQYLRRAWHCWNLQNNCKLRARRACRAIATHMACGTNIHLALRMEEFTTSCHLLLPSVLQLIFSRFSCKHQAFPLSLPRGVLAELCPSLCSGQCLLLHILRGRVVSSTGAGLVLLPIQGLTSLAPVRGGNAAAGAPFNGEKHPGRHFMHELLYRVKPHPLSKRMGSTGCCSS